MPTTPHDFATDEVITEARLDTHTTAITELQAADVTLTARLDALEAENSVSTADIANEAVTRVKLAPAVISEIEGKAAAVHTHTVSDLTDADYAASSHTHSVIDLTDADYAATSHAHSGSDITSGVVPAARGGAGSVTGILKADGLGTVTAATAGTDYSAGTASLATGLLKSTTTTGALSIAAAGTDYLAPNGNGSALTALNGSNIASGTVADGRLSANVPLKDAANVFKPASDSTTAFQVQPSASTTPTLDVDTTNGRIGIGTAAPTVALDVVGLGGIRSTNGVTGPGTGSNSERYGASAAAGGAGAVAVGYTANASGNYSTAIGTAATASTSTTALGRSANGGAANYSVVIGHDAAVTNNNAIAIGKGTTTAAGSSVVVGQGVSIGSTLTGAVAIGQGVTMADASLLSQSVAVGYTANAGDSRNTIVGAKASGTAVSCTALGRGARATAAHVIAIGRGAYGYEANSVNIGFSGATTGTNDVYFFNSSLSKWLDPVDNVTISLDPTDVPIVIHGPDAYDATASPTNDVAGGNLVLAGGRGTGTATGGNVVIQVAAAGGVSNNTKNPLADAVTIAPGGTMTVSGAVTAPSTILTATPPATQTSAGTAGEIRVNTTHAFICTQTGADGAAHWKRVAMDDTAW